MAYDPDVVVGRSSSLPVPLILRQTVGFPEFPHRLVQSSLDVVTYSDLIVERDKLRTAGFGLRLTEVISRLVPLASSHGGTTKFERLTDFSL